MTRTSIAFQELGIHQLSRVLSEAVFASTLSFQMEKLNCRMDLLCAKPVSYYRAVGPSPSHPFSVSSPPFVIQKEQHWFVLKTPITAITNTCSKMHIYFLCSCSCSGALEIQQENVGYIWLGIISFPVNKIIGWGVVQSGSKSTIYRLYSNPA